MVEIMISPEPRQCAECSQDRPVWATSEASTMPAKAGALGSLAVSTAAQAQCLSKVLGPGTSTQDSACCLYLHGPCMRDSASTV